MFYSNAYAFLIYRTVKTIRNKLIYNPRFSQRDLLTKIHSLGRGKRSSRFGRVWSTLRAHHALRAHASIRRACICIFTHNMRIEREREEDEEERSESERSEMHIARAIHMHIYTYVCTRASLTPPLRMHTLFHAHIIKSPKSREIAPRKGVFLSRPPIHLAGYRIPIPPFSLGSPPGSLSNFTAACHIGSLFNFVDRGTERDMCSQYLWGWSVTQHVEKKRHKGKISFAKLASDSLFRDLHDHIYTTIIKYIHYDLFYAKFIIFIIRYFWIIK